MKPVLLISAMAAAYFCKVEGQQSCPLPLTGQGQCVEVSKCPELAKLLVKPSRSQEEIELLRKAHCGFSGKTPQVCCPMPCLTPSRQIGECLNISSCSDISSRLTPPISKDTVQFIQNSRCDGLHMYSVCCGPPTNDLSATGSRKCTPSTKPPSPSSECCGIDNGSGNRIIGGNNTAIDQYPWLVAIEYQSGNNIKILCGGALISGRYVLTAAHCVSQSSLDSGNPVNVRLGDYDVTKNGPDCVAAEGGGDDCTDGAIVIPIEKIISHPSYNPDHSLRRHDIALLKLSRMAPYSDFIRPVCLPETDVTENAPSGIKLWVAGWGAIGSLKYRSNLKQHVDLPYKTHEDCQPAYNTAGRKIMLWHGQLCAGGDLNKDSCKGDSGGPLMYQNGNLVEVIGVVSFGPTNCGTEDVPGVYTRVFEYNSWIQENTIE